MNHKKIPLVSIIIPVYNGSNYLKESIDSAVTQTYPNCEVIVVNDGSDDHGATENIAKSYGNAIRYYDKKNGGVSTALNLGIEKMKGEYFSWLSHDDWYYPWKIEKEIEAVMESGDPYAIVQGEYEFYDMNTKTYTPTNFSKYYALKQITNSVFPVLQLQAHACSALIHKSHFERVGVFRENLRTIQDVEMWFRLFRNQKSIFIPEFLHCVREHDEADSKTVPCYHEETGDTYIKLIKSMDYNEIEAVFGTASSFLCRMAGFLKSYGQMNALDDVCNMISQCKDLCDEKEKMDALNEYIKGLSNEKANKIAIFGAGQYGIRMKYELESRLIKPDMFIDNSKNKQGTMIDGLPCISMEDASNEKENILVVAAQRILTPALKQLRGLGFPYVISKQELEAVIQRTPSAISCKERWLRA